jgi:alkylhydroperoxidase/carboxymuconolactone decarboxylase family protein YurZ
MKRETKNIGTAIAIALIAIAFIIPTDAISQNAGGRGGKSGMQQGMKGQWGSNLTDEQKAELQELVQSMREADNSREKIKTAVDALFEEWGIEKPEGRMGKGGRGDREPLLSDEQKAELKVTVQGLKDNGASREEIKAAVDALFETWGIEKPEGRMGRRGGKHGQHGAMMDLLDETQQEAVKTKMEEMKAADATREEIHEAITTMFADWGIEMPERSVPLEEQLTEDQIATVKAEVERLKDEGKSRQEIREALETLYSGFGLELPEHNKKGKGRFGGADLTDEQKEILKNTVADMKEQGATRTEIREAVKAMLEQWKNETPEEPTALTGTAKIKARNYPNPFNPTTQISFQIDEPGFVKVEVFNTRGQLVQTLLNEYRNQGLHNLTWNATNQTGEPVPTGMYFYKISAGEEVLTQQMLFVK